MVIKKLTNKKINFTFNPHLLPTFRGILSSIYVNVKKNVANTITINGSELLNELPVFVIHRSS